MHTHHCMTPEVCSVYLIVDAKFSNENKIEYTWSRGVDKNCLLQNVGQLHTLNAWTKFNVFIPCATLYYVPIMCLLRTHLGSLSSSQSSTLIPTNIKVKCWTATWVRGSSQKQNVVRGMCFPSHSSTDTNGFFHCIYFFLSNTLWINVRVIQWSIKKIWLVLLFHEWMNECKV